MKYTKDTIHALLELAGVYLFKDKNGIILYAGKAKNLKRRVSSYFQQINKPQKTINLVSQISSIEIIPVNSEYEALLLEAKLVKKHQPKYNVILKDNKHYIYIKITPDKFPRIIFSRREDDHHSIYFGPFPSASIVYEILAYLRSIFSYCTQNPKIKRPCFYTHLGLCNPCPAEIMKKKGESYQIAKNLYFNHIRHIKLLLSGKINPVKKYLQEKMKFYSLREEYEEAAKYRDKLDSLEYLVTQFQPAEAYLENPSLFAQNLKLEAYELSTILKNHFDKINIIRRIECYDISNIMGKFATGSMITFVDGLPDKKFYRRFRIRAGGKPDDFAMLTEVMTRRLLHKDWLLPDLFVIDGGMPQLIALKKVLLQFNVNLPIIGLSKREEEIVIPEKKSFARIKLPMDAHALHLMMRLRDEAHRFAHKYHTLLRLKNLLYN